MAQHGGLIVPVILDARHCIPVVRPETEMPPKRQRISRRRSLMVTERHLML